MRQNLRKQVQHKLSTGIDLTRWVGSIGLAVAVGIAYFVAARLSLALLTKPEGVAVFWPAAGVSAGVLIALGSRARWPVVVGTMAATIVANLLEAAISPAVALLLERLEAVGQQAVTVAAQQAAQLFAEAAGLLLVGDTETRIGYLQKVADAFYCQRDVVRTLYVSA